MRFTRFPTVPDTSSEVSPGLIVGAVFLFLMWGLFGFHWPFIFLAIGVGALVDTWMGYEQVEQPVVKTKTTYERKHKK